MKHTVTLHDIARESGVSFNTVSRALNDKPDINEQTRRQVLEVAKRLDYRPNQLARGLRQRRTATIGVVIADLANPFFTEVVEGIERALALKGYSIILANTAEDSVREQEAVRTLVERRVDGILIVPTQHDDLALGYLTRRGVPHCLLARFFAGTAAQAVINDDREGARLAVAHLLARGHRRILHLNGPHYNSSARLRLEGYRLAHAEAGRPVDEDLIVETDARMEGGLTAVERALQTGLTFTSISCFSDYVCFGAMRALRKAGLSIPRDVAVIGYDDVELAELVSPALSTVRIAKARLGEIAAHALVARIEGGDGLNDEGIAEHRRGKGTAAVIPGITGDAWVEGPIVLQPELIVREST